MNARCRRFTLLALSACLAFAVHAQESPEAEALPEPSYYKPLRFETVTQEDGLSQTTVATILQDHQGYLWFGVEGGLNRYDGYDFKVYTTSLFDTTSLSGNPYTLFEDRAGVLWVGTNGGLNRFDRETETFTRFPADLNDSTSVGGTIIAIEEDQAGALWVGIGTRLGGRGLRRMDRETGVLTAFWNDPDDTTSLSHNRVRAIHEDNGGRLWIGTPNGLDRMDPESGAFMRYDLPSVWHIQDDPSRPDVLWLGTDDGLLEFDVNTGATTRYLDDLPIPISRMTPDPDRPHVFWLVQGALFQQGNGLIRFDTRTGEYTRYQNNPSDPQSLPSNNVFSVYADRSGIVWAGVQKTGLTRFDPSPDGFLHYRNIPGDPESLPGNAAWNINEDHEGRLLALIESSDARGGGRLVRIDRLTGAVKTFEHDSTDPNSVSAGSMQRIFVDSRGLVWIILRNGLLNRLDPKTDRVTRYRHNPNDPKSLPSNQLSFAVEEDGSGRLWFSTSGDGLVRFDPETETFASYRHDPADISSLSDNNTAGIGGALVGLLVGRDGALWVGTNNGLNRFDLTTEHRRARCFPSAPPTG